MLITIQILCVGLLEIYLTPEKLKQSGYFHNGALTLPLKFKRLMLIQT